MTPTFISLCENVRGDSPLCEQVEWRKPRSKDFTSANFDLTGENEVEYSLNLPRILKRE